MTDGTDAERAPAAGRNRAFRSDVLIAVCALLVSSLASGASWWQARLLSEQTRVLKAQLGAQVWPYVGISEAIDNATVSILLGNDGLGPAVIRSLTVSVDGVRKASMSDVLHAVLGPNLYGRTPRGERLRLGLDGLGPGGVLRTGGSTALLTLTSKTFEKPLVLGYERIAFHVCYCAIVPGQCWSADSMSTDPRPQTVCPEIRDDLLHVDPSRELQVRP